jgi:hypothetical protein
MKSNTPDPSPLRQMIDVLGAAMDEAKTEPAVIQQCCANISMAAGDIKTPLPKDVFQSGVSETLQRCALTGLCFVVISALNRQPK